MKLINKYKSPNYNSRKFHKIKFIIIHYTALANCNEAITHLCKADNKVSCHYLISQNGQIYSLVDEKKRAWHAGFSYWDSITDINSCSIGIEIDYSNNKNNRKFTNKIINSLKNLLYYLKKKYKIDEKNILGHSDIAPYRKIDPGKNFPWKNLHLSKLVFMPKNINKNVSSNIINWFKSHGFKSKKTISIFILMYIGYDILPISYDKNLYKNLILSYQSHFNQKNISGKLDIHTFNKLVEHFLSLLLTKMKKNLLKH